MARIKKFSPKENLTSFNTFLIDSGDNSDYFRITEFKDTFTGGKNGFLIEGSPYLKESTEIKIEILDVNGDPIYYEPGNGIPEYYEGISKLIAVYVYNDTPIGTAKITILGELKEYLDETGVVRQIPSEWQGVYNVKWEREFKVNKLLSNEDRVRFYRRPQVNIDEIVKPIFSGNPPTKTQTGTVDGLSLVPVENTDLSKFTLPTSYRLKVNSGAGWTGSMENQIVSFDNLNYSPRIDEVVNETELIVSPPYSENNLVKNFNGEDYSITFTHLEGFNDLATALTGSFAKIRITDMKTFVGDAARVKVFRRSQSNLTDYEFVQEIQLESNELLRDIETKTKSEETYGFFTQDILNQYWDESSTSISSSLNQDFLYNSVKLSGSAGNYFFTTQSFNIEEGVEYTLDFNVRKSSTNPNHSLRFFLSGSYNGSSKSQDITTVNSSTFILQKTNFNENIIAQNFDSASLYVEPIGDDWYINNISLKASQETSFSPDEITFIQQVPKTLEAETFDYRFEFYDINNNYIPVRVEQSKTFVGGNLNLFRKSIEVTPDNLYFAFDSASNPANPLPPTVINFDVQTNVITGSINYTSGAYDFFGNEISSSEYVGGQYPGYLSDWDVRGGKFPFLTVQDFTGSRDDITVQFIRYTAEVEGVSDTFIITRVEDGKGGVSHEIVPYRGTIIKNKESKTLEIQAVRVDGINRIDLRDGLTRNFSDAKLHLASASLDNGVETTTYVSLSQAITNPNFITGISAGKTGSGEIDYNAEFTRDAIDNELTVYLMNGPTTSSILTSLILTDLKDGLNNGLVSSTADQFNVKYVPREPLTFNPLRSQVTASFQRRGTTLNPLSASLEIFPSSSIEPKTEIPHFYMFYVTGAFDDTITVAVTDYLGNRIDSGIPGVTSGVAYYDAVETKQLNLEFTYTEPITSASVTANKSFFITPDGLPGRDSIVIEIEPSPVQIGANHKGDVYDYTIINPTIQVTQGDLFLIHTASGDPGTFTTSSVNGIVPTGITLSGSEGVNSTSMSLYGFSNMTALSASVQYNFDVYPYFTSSLITQSRVQRFNKVIEGTSAIEVILEPSAVNFNADELGYVSQYAGANTELVVRQQEEYLAYDESNSGTPGTYTASLVATNITIGDLSSSNQYGEITGDDTFHVDNFSNMSATTASVVYNLIVYPYSLKNGVAGVPTTIKKKQIFTRTSDGSKARKVNLIASSNTVVYNGDGNKVAPEGNITLSANAINTTGSAYFEFLNQDTSTLQASSTFNEATLGSEDLPNTGSQKTFTVNLRDGSATGPIVDSDAVTITGIQEGATPYTVQLSNPSTTVTVEVDGTTYFDNSATEIHAYKGGNELQFVEIYDEEAVDPITFLPIGTEGQFSASIFEISPALTHLSGSIVSQSGQLYGISAGVSNWNTPQTNVTGYIIFKIDFENGRAAQYVQQSFSTVFEGAVGPGIVVRGEWTGSLDYLYTPERRDVVIYRYDNAGTEETHYFATTDTLVTASGQPPYTFEPIYTPGMDEGTYDTNNWEYLGQQDFFVAAKIAIFEESFVENTINVGIPQAGDGQNANIAIVGGTNEPYISIGQNGTQGYAQPGVFLGLTRDGGPLGGSGTSGILSVASGTDGQGRYNSLEWNGETLTIRGAINQTSAGIVAGSLRGLWTGSTIYYPDDIVSNEGQSWIMDGEPHTASLSHEPGVGISYAESWSLNIPSGSSAQNLSLSADSQIFRVAKDGTITPSTITLTANRQNINTPTSFVSSPSVVTGSSGDTATITSANFGSNTAVTFTAIAGAFSDEITIVKLEEGSDAITVVNTNQSHTVPASSAGVVSSFAGSGTKIEVYEGATKLAYDATPDGGDWYVSDEVVSPTGDFTLATPTIGADYIEYGDGTAMDNATDVVTIRYAITGSRANGLPFTIDTFQTITKAKTGADGASGQAAGVTYAGRWTDNIASPALPYSSGVTYMGEDTLKYVVKYNDGSGDRYYVSKVSHTPRGIYDAGQTYVSEDAAGNYVPDVVRKNLVFYKVKAGQGPVTGTAPDNPTLGSIYWDTIGSSITPGTWTDGWEAFGAQFTSVATDILFAEDVYANRTINIGSDDANKPVIALNADSASGYLNPFISIGQGAAPGFGNEGIYLGYNDQTASFSLLSPSGSNVNIGGLRVDKEGIYYEGNRVVGQVANSSTTLTIANNGTSNFDFEPAMVGGVLAASGLSNKTIASYVDTETLTTTAAGYNLAISLWSLTYISGGYVTPVGGPATKTNGIPYELHGWRDDPVEAPEAAANETWFVDWRIDKNATLNAPSPYALTNEHGIGYNLLSLPSNNLNTELGITDGLVTKLREDTFNVFPAAGGESEIDTSILYPTGSRPILYIESAQDGDQNYTWANSARVGYQVLDVVNSGNNVNTTGYDTIVLGRRIDGSTNSFEDDFIEFESTYGVSSANNGIAPAGASPSIAESVFRNIQLVWSYETSISNTSTGGGVLSLGSLDDVTEPSEFLRMHSSGSNGNSRPYLSMGQLTQSYDEDGIFLGFISGSDDGLLSIKSNTNSLLWDGGTLTINGQINGGGLRQGSTVEGSAIYVPSINAPSFSVDTQGNVTAESATIRGTIQATDGNIGDWIIDLNTQVLRDDNSEIVFDPNTPEVGLYTDSSKTVRLAPTGGLSPVTSTSATISGLSSTPPVPADVSSLTTSTLMQYSTAFSSDSNLIAVGGVPDGTYPVAFTIGAVTLSATGMAVADANTAYPNYDGSSQGQIHGTQLTTRGARSYVVSAILKYDDGTGVFVYDTGDIYFLFSLTAYGGYEYSDVYVWDIGAISVTGDTPITLWDGTTKKAEDIDGDDLLLVWDEENDRLIPSQISAKQERTVDRYFLVKTETESVKVSDTHAFYLEGNIEKPVQELIPNTDKIFVYKDGTLIKELVLSVEEVEANVNVYTFRIPNYENYISANILSHNPLYLGDWFFSDDYQLFGGQNGSKSSNTIVRNMAFDKSKSSVGFTGYKLCYRVQLGASSARVTDTSANGTSTIRYIQQTNSAGAGGSTSRVSSYTLPTTLTIDIPSNITEITGKGIQVLSGTNEYVRIERSNFNKKLIQMAGGDLIFGSETAGQTTEYGILPGLDSIHTLGDTSHRWKEIWTDALNGATLSTSAANSGYIRFHDNIFIQWVRSSNTSNDQVSGTWPTPFSVVFGAVVSKGNASSTYESAQNAATVSYTTSNWYVDVNDTNRGFFIIAIGTKTTAI